MKYAWIKEHRDSYPVALMCQLLEVSKSGFYQSLKAAPSPRAQRSQRIRESVAKAFEQSNGIYGSPKISKQLKSEVELESACRNTVAKAMAEMGLKSKVRRDFKPTTTQVDSSKKPAANILNQNFKATAPNQKWVTDITYLRTAEGWVYLAVVLDLFSRKVVGWEVSPTLETSLVLGALRKAIESRNPAGKQLMLHSDRGCQYTSDVYQQTLKAMQITCSMSRTGCCYDNAVMERFFWSLKLEWTNHEQYENLEAAKLSVFRYIETFYNRTRIHEALNYQSPDGFERSHLLTLAV